MGSNWFNDDFFTRPSRFRLLRNDPWGSLDRLNEDFDVDHIFSDFAAKAESLRDRMAQGRFQRLSPVKKPQQRRGSEQSVDGIASPTPSSVNSSAFNYSVGGNQGHVSFPTSSTSNVSDCSDKSIESLCTEKSATHSAVSEALPDGGQHRKADSTESWVDRNTSGRVIGEGSTSQTRTTEIRPGYTQDYSKQETAYVGTSGTNSMASMQTCEEKSSGTSSSSKTVTCKTTKQTTTCKQSPDKQSGKPFRVPPNRSIFYDELDSSLLPESFLSSRRRTRALDHVSSLVDEVVHHDRLFQTELDDFLQSPRRTSRLLNNTASNSNGDKDSGVNRSRGSTDELKKENESLQQEVTRLQQVLQEVTTVNKRWQRYNNDRRMYVQKLLATIQELQEQLNHHGEAELQRSVPSTNDSSTPASTSELERLRRQNDEHLQLLRLQIKSHKDDWEVERREKNKAVQEKDGLIEKVAKLEAEIAFMKAIIEEEKKRESLCTCHVNDMSHISSQDFTPRPAYQASFQVPYNLSEEISSSYSERDTSSFNIVEEEDESQQSHENKELNTSVATNEIDSYFRPKSLFMGYPDDGLATVLSFSNLSQEEEKITSSSNSSQNKQDDKGAIFGNQRDTVVCPNCSRIFPASRHLCFLDHYEFCSSTDATKTASVPIS